MKARTAIATATCAIAAAGGGVAAAASSAGAATAHTTASAVSQQAAGSSSCIIFSKTYVNGVRIRTGHSTSSGVVGYATPDTPYTTDHCTITKGSTYNACGLTSNRWEQIRVHGRWYWTAAACWAPTIRL